MTKLNFEPLHHVLGQPERLGELTLDQLRGWPVMDGWQIKDGEITRDGFERYAPIANVLLEDGEEIVLYLFEGRTVALINGEVRAEAQS